MAQKIHLNGGPWHDGTISVPDGKDHFHVVQPLEWPSNFTEVALGDFSKVPTRMGMYSQVRGRPGEFEWDGWTSHE